MISVPNQSESKPTFGLGVETYYRHLRLQPFLSMAVGVGIIGGFALAVWIASLIP